ncbi:MAG TPA: glycosyltransferase family 4 protein [Candidatus Omnitrophota bacterium]|nr:glycosyltransferase family 4 protein [Candidatus Omnitrophota bacterium]
MKIAFFHNLPSGGGLKTLCQKANCLRQKGHEIVVYSFSSAEKDFPRLWDHVTDHQVVIPLEFRGGGKYRAYQKASEELAGRINQSDVDMVLVDKCRFLGSPTMMRYLKKPFIFYTQEPLRYKEHERLAPPDFLAKNFIHKKKPIQAGGRGFRLGQIFDHLMIRKIDRQNLRKAENIWTNSCFSQAWLQRVYNVRAEVVYQGIDVECFKPEPGLKKTNRVLSVGRISRIKGYDLLLEAITKIPVAVRPGWDIVCDDETSSYSMGLQKQAEENGVDLRVFRRIHEKELCRLYQESKVVLCASHREPFGLVPLEAMACGTPVIAVDEGGYRETVVHGKTGLLLPRDPALWVQHIQEIFKEPEMRENFGTAGRQRVERQWTWKNFIDAIESWAQSHLERGDKIHGPRPT